MVYTIPSVVYIMNNINAIIIVQVLILKLNRLFLKQYCIEILYIKEDTRYLDAVIII